MFLGHDGVLLGLLTRRSELTGWLHIRSQALGTIVCPAGVIATAGWRAALAELVPVTWGVSLENVAVVMLATGTPGKQPGDALTNIAAFLLAGLLLAVLPFKGLVEQAGKPVETSRPGGGEPPVVGPRAKDQRGFRFDVAELPRRRN